MKSIPKCNVWSSSLWIARKLRQLTTIWIQIGDKIGQATTLCRYFSVFGQLPQLKQAKAKGKLAYFSLDKLIIRDRPNGSTHGLNV